MARYWKLLFCMVIVLAVTGFASAQSLGDIARKERAKPRPQAARVITNEDIPSVDVSKDEPKPVTGVTGDTTASGDNSEGAAEGKKSGVEEQNALNSEWKQKVAAEKSDVASLEREVDLMQREEKLRVAVYYSDAGNRLRNAKEWEDQERKYQADLANKQKSLAAAKEKLNSALESARKAGATGYE